MKKTCQILVFQRDSNLINFRDLNAQAGDSDDFIPGVDILLDRDMVDFQKNSYCDMFLDFFFTTGNFCVVNGQNSVAE